MTVRTSFPSGRGTCTAWLTLPEGEGPFPAVVLAHGGGAIRAMMLENYERAFSEAGFAVVSFDYRHFGESPGEPRQMMSMRKQLQDIRAAIDFAMMHPKIDRTRVALWGTSLAGGHAVTVASRHPHLAAALVQCPILVGRAPALVSGFGPLVRLTWPILSDTVRSILKLPRLHVKLVGAPGELALITREGALHGWNSVTPPGVVFDNRVTAGVGLSMFVYRPIAKAKNIRCPLLVCVSDNEELQDPAIAVRASQLAPKGERRHYAADHFSVYHAPVVERVLADQTEFLQRHLMKVSPTGPGRSR